MKMSKLYAPTLREVPNEAELVSHQLLLRAGMARMLAAGIYTYLPLGLKVIKKIEQIVRQEMNAIGSQETLMSALLPAELWQESGRWDKFGPDMFKLKDRHQRDFCLGPTHEEIFTHIVRHEVKSYKQLPLSLYQIQTKFRDEKRPRFGLMRGREFIMKDAYTFDKDAAEMKVAYDIMASAYRKIFDRCGLKYKIVEGDPGAMGGNGSHEFIALSELGESQIIYCDACEYAATDEEAVVAYRIADDSAMLPTEKVSTPDVKTIEELSNFFALAADRFAKMVLYKCNGQVIAVMLPGDREINPIKLINYLGVGEHELEMADEATVERVTGAAVGFAGPIGLDKSVKLIVDRRITEMKNFIVGANQTDYHIKNVNYGRDFKGEVVADLVMAVAGDQCPHCAAPMAVDRGNEVGNIFQLGTKYAKSMHATYLDENGKEQYIYMGSHGIGVSRTMAAIIEQYHDDDGIVWPLAVAPFEAIITVVNAKKDEQMALGLEIYEALKAQGVDVLLDDRKERAGVKFKDAELIGIPLAVNVGKLATEKVVEFKLRSSAEKIEMSAADAVQRIVELVNEAR